MYFAFALLVAAEAKQQMPSFQGHLDYSICRRAPISRTDPALSSHTVRTNRLSEDGTVLFSLEESFLRQTNLSSGVSRGIELFELGPRSSSQGVTGFRLAPEDTMEQRGQDTAAARVSVQGVLAARNASRATVLYNSKLTSAREGNYGIAEAHLHGWSDHNSNVMIRLPSARRVHASAAGFTRSSRICFWEESRLSGQTPKTHHGLTVILNSGATKDRVVDVHRRIVVIAYDDRKDTVIMGGVEPKLEIIDVETGDTASINLPGTDQSSMRVHNLAWLPNGDLLVGVTKFFYYDFGRMRYEVPRLYRFDPRDRRFKYLGSYSLLASSVTGEWILLGESREIKNIWLVKTSVRAR